MSTDPIPTLGYLNERYPLKDGYEWRMFHEEPAIGRVHQDTNVMWVNCRSKTVRVVKYETIPYPDATNEELCAIIYTHFMTS